MATVWITKWRRVRLVGFERDLVKFIVALRGAHVRSWARQSLLHMFWRRRARQSRLRPYSIQSSKAIRYTYRTTRPPQVCTVVTAQSQLPGDVKMTDKL